MDDEILRQLDEILGMEREALLAGNLDALHPLLEQKESILTTLQTTKTDDESGLKYLQNKMLHNQKMLEGALQGIRSITERLATVKRVRETLETYDLHGQRTEMKVARTAKLEKRA